MLDARLAGRSRREIAVELHGEAKVAEKWSPDSALRAQVRWRVRTALALMRGGYLELAAGRG